MTTNSSQTPISDELDRITEDYSTRDLLDSLANYEAQISMRIEDAVQQARREGLSWSEVGALLGVSKQAAQQRYGH